MSKIKIKLKPVFGGWEVEQWLGDRWIHWLPPVVNKVYNTKSDALKAAKQAKKFAESGKLATHDLRFEEVLEI